MTAAGLPFRLRMGLVLACTLAVACAAIYAIAGLQDDATHSRDAERRLVDLRLQLAQIQDVPWGASPDEGDDPDDVRNELQGDEQAIVATLDDLERREGLPERDRIRIPLRKLMGALSQILELVADGRGEATDKASSVAAHQGAIADEALQKAGKRYRADA